MWAAGVRVGQRGVLLRAPGLMHGFQEEPQVPSGVTQAMGGLEEGPEGKSLLGDPWLARTSWPGSSDSPGATRLRGEPGHTGAPPCK